MRHKIVWLQEISVTVDTQTNRNWTVVSPNSFKWEF